MEFIAALGLFPVLVTKLTDTIRNLLDPMGTRFPKVAWNFVPFVLGVGICLIYQTDAHDLIAGLPPALAHLSGVGGQIVTGLGLGALAGGWHEIFDLLSGVAKSTHASAVTKLQNATPAAKMR